MFLGERAKEGFWGSFFEALSPTGLLYGILYFVLIIMFAYFYLTIQYNPIEMANNLRQNNGTIPGIRPGKPTSDFISKILSKITLIGALFLAVIALLPIIYSNATAMHGLSFGGTSILDYGWRCSRHREAAGIPDDDASLQGLPLIKEESV